MKLDELHIKEFLGQPKKTMKKVWQPEKTGGGKKHWYHGNVKGNKTKWPAKSFSGKAQDYEGHILK